MDGIGYMQLLKPKMPSAIQLSSNLAAYISSAYNQDPKEYMSELKELENLRSAVISAPISLQSVDLLKRYICQVSFLPTRFPVDEDNIKLAIGWYNSWPADKGSNKPLAYFSWQYEQASVMFNLGVLLSRLGVSDVGNGKGLSADPLKSACGLFMQAAGAFQEVTNVLGDQVAMPPSCDLCSQVIKGMVQLMLGQAQECIYWKGVNDGGSEGVLAKVALAASDLYSGAITAFGDVPVLAGSNEGRALVAATRAKAGFFHVVAEMKKAKEAANAYNFGEEFGRLSFVNDSLIPRLSKSLEECHGVNGLKEQLKSLKVSFSDEFTRAKKDNQLIYHEIPVPRAQQSAIASALMVKPIPPVACDRNVPSIFESLIPLRLHQTLNRYQRAKVDKVSEVLGQFEGIKNSLHEVLKKNNLPGALEAIEQPIGLPESLVVKIRELESHGGMAGLNSSLSLLQQLSKEAQKVLRECEGILSDEAKEDERLRSSFGASVWKRLRSRQAASTYYEKVEQVRNAIHSAADADAVITGRLDRYGKDLDIMCSGSIEAVALLIPSMHSTNRLTPATRIASDRLKSWLTEVFKIQQQIDSAVSELSSFSDNDYPVRQLSNASNSDEGINSAIVNELNKYSRYGQQVKAWQEQSQSHIKSGQVVIREFQISIAENSSSSSHERQSALQRLDDAYKHYLLVNKDLADGINFYTSLIDPLNRLKSDIADYATSRVVEAEELISELKRSESPLLKSPVSSVFPAASAPSEPWPSGTRSGQSAYPASIHNSYGSSSSNDPNATNSSKYQWIPGMPINYAKK